MASIKVRDLVKRLKADGWVSIGFERSHQHFAHPTKPGKVTVPSGHRGNADIPPGTLRSIERLAGLRR